MKILVSDQMKRLWFEEKLLKEYLRDVHTRQSNRVLQTELQSPIFYLCNQVLSYQVLPYYCCFEA